MLSSIIKAKGGLFFLVVASALSVVFFAQPASAGQNSIDWVDNFNVEYQGRIYTSDNDDQDWSFYNKGEDGCYDEITNIDWKTSKDYSAPTDDEAVLKDFKQSAAAGCSLLVEGGVSLPLGSANNALISFEWNNGAIDTTYKNADYYKQFIWSEADGLYADRIDPTCKSTLSTTVGSNQATLIISRKKTSDAVFKVFRVGFSFRSVIATDFDASERSTECDVSKPITVTLGKTENAKDPTFPPDEGVLAEGGGEIAPVCETVSVVDTLDWVGCSVLRGLDKLMSKLDSTIPGLLIVTPDDYNVKDDGYYQAWKNMTTLATIAIVFTALFMVISTALDMGLFSNYTVKKYIPRLLVATIGIQFSWIILTFAILVINQLGDGMEAILFTPFGDAKDFDLQRLFGDSASLSEGVLFASAAGVGAVALSSLTVFGVMGFAIGLAGSIFFAFVFLLLRKIAIILLLVVSPLAIAAWVLPGNDNLWNTWRKTFFGLLFMYPAIITVISMGKIFAWASVSQGGSGVGPTSDEKFTGFMLGIVAYGAGYAAIPYAVKSFSGALGAITGQLNNKSKGLFDRAKNYTSERDQMQKKVRADNKDQNRRIRYANNQSTRRDRFALGLTGDKIAGRESRLAAELNRSSVRTQGHQDALSIKQNERLPSGLSINEESARAKNSMFNPTAELANIRAAELKSATDSAKNSINQRNEGLGRSALLKDARNVAKSSTNEAEVMAAIQILAQQKDYSGLSDVQYSMASGSEQQATFWNKAMGANYGDIKEISPSLVTEIKQNVDVQTRQAKLRSSRNEGFVNASDEQRSGMSKDAWVEALHSTDPPTRAAMENSFARIKANDKLRSSMTDDTLTAVSQAVRDISGDDMSHSISGDDWMPPGP